MCAYMWPCEHPTTTTLWIGQKFILHKSLVCFGKLWLQIYQLESSCTVVPSCERNILMQIDTDIILIVLDPKQYMSQNILKYWSVWRWFKPSLKTCNVFRDFWDQPYVGLSFVNAYLCIISKIMFVWFQHNVSPMTLVTLSDNTTGDDFGYSNGLHHTDNMRELHRITKPCNVTSHLPSSQDQFGLVDGQILTTAHVQHPILMMQSALPLCALLCISIIP
jgi:hypothetical protein